MTILSTRLQSLFITGFFAAAATVAADAAPNVLSLSSYDRDSTVVLPESFETDVQKMMENWYIVNYTALDADVDRKPDAEVTDQEIINRLAAIPTTIELPYNSIVRGYIDAYTKRNRSLVENMLGMSLYYMPIFEQALERENLPLELKYLPIIESALNPDAVSRSGATGLWQLMLPTARGFGMEVNTLVDERRDPVASSAVAAKLLRQLYDIYGDWSLTIAAYNCGPGNINKAIRRAGGTVGAAKNTAQAAGTSAAAKNAAVKDFWAIYPYLPKQTRGYMPGFIAATYVMNYYKQHNISPALAKKPILTDSVTVSRRIYFPQIAEVLGVPVEELRILNPQYRQDCIPGDIRPYSLVLPANQVYSYIMSEEAIAANNADQYARRLTVEPSELAAETAGAAATTAAADSAAVDADGYVTTEKTVYHKVRRGETLSSIARHYGVSVWSLKQANGNISKARRGRTLKVITKERTYKGKPVATPPAEGGNLLVKQTTPADSAATPAAQESAQAAETSTAHNSAQASRASEAAESAAESTESAEPIQREAAPAKSTASAKKDSAKSNKSSAKNKKNKKKTDKTRTVTAKSGDSLDRIARKNGTTVKELKRLNNLSGNNPVIQPGQKIRVK